MTSRVYEIGNGVWGAETLHPSGAYMMSAGSYYSRVDAERAVARQLEAFPPPAGPSTGELELVRTKIAEAIYARMTEGLSYDDATAEAFAYCDERWPTVVAALIAEARS